MNDFKKYLRIVRLIREGRANQLSTKDYQFFRDFTLDPVAVAELKQSREYIDLPADEKTLFESNLAAFQTPEFRENVLLAGEDIEKGELAEKITTGLNLALAGSDILSSVKQIDAATQARNSLDRPQTPPPLTRDPELAGALADAKRGNLDAARAMSPAQLAILDQYLSDLDTAKTVSGGQAGVFGSLAQTASTRRGKRSLELAPIYDELVSRNENRYDRLLGTKLNENQAIQQSRSQFYPYELQQYGLESRAAGQLESTGRSNLRSSVGSFGGFLPNVLSQIKTRKRFRDIYNANLMYDEDNAKTMAEADLELRSIYDNPGADFYQQQERLYGIPS